ncbi:MAG: Arc family DNA-binding protein [Rhodothermales bacterium]|nr:Arc family DNA-binding protein [Rhodothermales bacterium]
MATITLKNVPDDLHRRLKERAARHHRSLNREAIRCLEEAVAADPPAEADLLDRIRRRREALAQRGLRLTQEDVDGAIDEGRP